MSDTEADPDITVCALQSRLSELQTLWQTTKRRESTFSTHSGDADTSGHGHGEEDERPLLLTGTGGLQPTKPISPPLRSPRPHHVRVPSIEVAAMSHSGTGSRESISSMLVPAPPHSPPASLTSTPRARQRAAMQASHSSPPERAAVEQLTLPPLLAHAPATLTCPQCGAKVPSVTSRFCSQCGVQLSGG